MAVKPIQILLVEDNPADALIVQELLGDVPLQPCTVYTADRLRQALDIAAKDPPDVILLDLGLPDSQGVESLSRLRRDLSTVPVIVLTYLDDEAMALTAAREGAQDYLVKGQFTGPMLVRSIRYALERTRSEEALRAGESRLQESEDRLRLAIDSTQLGVFDFAPQTGSLILSELARCHSGIRSDVTVTYDTFLGGVHPDDRERIDGSVQEALRQPGIGHCHYATSYRTIGIEDGEERHIEAWGRTVFDDSGKATRFVGITSDVSSQRQTEAVLREADKRKDEFLAVLAHELRNPLAPIRFALKLLEREPEHDPAAGRAIKIIDRQVGHLARLIDDLLDVSRMTRNNIQLRIKRVSVDDVVSGAVEVVSAAAQSAGQTLDIERLPTTEWLDADAERLVQVFSNVLNNAVKFTPGGGRISIRIEKHDDTVTVHVVDNGIGFSTESQVRLFDMFYQEDSTINGSGGGLGIGLTLARALVVMHGGTIEAHSGGPGLGAHFSVKLPCVARLAVNEGPVPHTGSFSPAGRRLRVLIVDDNADAADMLQVFVSILGHDTDVAYDGPSALAHAESFRPDVMLLDIGLPGMNGYDVARAVRRHTALRDVYIAAVTGWGQDEDRRRTCEAGCDSHWTKPVNPSLLENLMHAVAHTVACSGCDQCLKTARTRASDSVSK